MQEPIAEADTGSTEAKVEVYECKKCPLTFPTFGECFKHDLLKHTLNKPGKSKQRSIHNYRNAQRQLELDIEKEGDNPMPTIDLATLPDECHIDAVLDFFLIPEHKLRNVVKIVMTDIGRILKRDCCLFGSAFTGLCLKTSDLDLFVHRAPYEKHIKICMRQMANCLRRSGCFDKVFSILHAKAPIIKCYHKKAQINIDISVSNFDGVANSNFIRDVLSTSPKMRQLVTLLKIWHKKFDLYRLNLTCYCFMWLIFFYLQHGVETSTGTVKLLPSIKDLQQGCSPVYVKWANCAYNMQRAYPWPEDLSVMHVLKGFFKFYSNVGLESMVISPYLGKMIPKTNFAKNFDFEEYNLLLQRVATESLGMDDPVLQTTSCICVQDPFFMNSNLSKAINRTNLGQIRKAFIRSKEISFKAQDSTTFYTNLFIRSVHDYLGLSKPWDDPANLKITINPSSKDFKFLLTKVPQDDIFKVWSRHYVESLERILVQLFKFSLEHSSKKPRMDDMNLLLLWKISSHVDLCTNRSFKRDETATFFESQIKQTNQLLTERSGNPKFSFRVEVDIRVEVSHERQCIELNLVAPTDARPKNIRKFFNVFKCAISNLKIRELYKS